MEIASDGAEHRMSDVVNSLAERFQLTPEERQALLPSGRQTTIANRVGWSKTYLAMAGLLDRSKRGIVLITDRGRQVMDSHPPRIDVEFLRQFPEFEEFRTATRNKGVTDAPATDGEPARTPEELLEEGDTQLRVRLSDELLARLHDVTPTRFERIVLDVLRKMGYGDSRPDAAQAIGRTGDGGIDGLINQDPLGLDIVYLQAKRWEPAVQRPDVQKFVGSLEGQRARKGVFITTSSFSSGAAEYVRQIDKKVILIDGKRLAELMIEHSVGVTVEKAYSIKRLDLDYFEDQEG